MSFLKSLVPFSDVCSFHAQPSVVGKSLLELLIEQFEDMLVQILLAAAVISFVSRLLTSYNSNSSPDTRVFRRGREREIHRVCGTLCDPLHPDCQRYRWNLARA